MFYWVYSGSCALAFVLIHTGTRALGKRKFTFSDGVTVAWGASYTLLLWVFAGFANEVWLELGGHDGEPESVFWWAVIIVGIPGAVSAVLVACAWRSIIVGFVVLITTILVIAARVAWDDDGWVFGAPVFWNAAYLVAAGSAATHPVARAKRHPVDVQPL